MHISLVSANTTTIEVLTFSCYLFYVKVLGVMFESAADTDAFTDESIIVFLPGIWEEDHSEMALWPG